MKRDKIVPALVLGLLFVGVPASAALLWARSRPVEAPPVLAQPAVRDVVLKTVATGSVVPRNEVAIKPRVSGILDRLHVEPGDAVTAGQLIADIRVVPNSARLATARSGVREADILLSDAKRERDQVAALVASGAASSAELARMETALKLRSQELDAARTDLTIVREGANRAAGRVSTSVRSTVDGMVLTVPMKEGASVIEANTFNEGTTVAEVADMGDLVFEGLVDEAEVGRIREGMPLSVVIAAWPDETLPGTLEHIAPKGVDVQGAIQFEIRAALTLPDGGDGRFVRAGMSANADIVLDRRAGALTINEALLKFEGDQPMVEVQQGDRFADRAVQLGLSDGIHTEVLGGITAADTLRRPEG